MNVIDVNGFKQGMAAIFDKYHMAAFRSLEEGAMIQIEGKTLIVKLINMISCHPSDLLQDVVEFKDFDPRAVMYDVIDLFKYFGVTGIFPGTDDHFFIGFDDGGTFVFENVMIKGEEHHENPIQQRESE